MRHYRARAVMGAILVAIILLGSALSMAQSRSTFGEVIARKLTVQAGGLAVQSAVDLDSTLNVDGATTLGSTLSVAGATSAAAVTATGLTINGNANITGTFNASGNSTVGGTFGVTGDTALAGDLFITMQDAIAVTEGGTITPTGTVQELTASGAVSTTQIADAAGSGTILILINTSANEITLGDTYGNLVLSGDAVLGQWDTITLINRVATWYEIAQADN